MNRPNTNNAKAARAGARRRSGRSGLPRLSAVERFIALPDADWIGERPVMGAYGFMIYLLYYLFNKFLRYKSA